MQMHTLTVRSELLVVVVVVTCDILLPFNCQWRQTVSATAARIDGGGGGEGQSRETLAVH